MNLTINQQKSSDQLWKDEAGQKIPYKRVSAYERKAEAKLAQLARAALTEHERLVAFKKNVQEIAADLYKAFIVENGGKEPGKGKGGATFYNFDRSIKVTVKVNDQITFDDNLIKLAQDALNELLEDGLQEAKDFVKPLVMDAFQTSRGNLDTKRVLGLRRHAKAINDPRYDRAMDLIDKAIRRPSSKEYFQVWVMDANGEYKDIQLNFAVL